MTKPPSIRVGFEMQGVSIPLDCLLPTRMTADKVKQSSTYPGLVASVREVGIIEPLSVFPLKGSKYLILDGHVRLEALRELGATEAPCLIASTDEGYTYNQKVNRIAPIQANRMILKALDAGLSEERVAKALNLSTHTVKANRTLLEGICKEAIELLKDRQVSRATLTLFKKVKPMRQMEIAEIMVGGGNYTAGYARALVGTTTKDQLVDGEDPKKPPSMKPEDLARVEHEMKVTEKDFRLLDESYNDNVMSLTIARGYLRRLLDNSKVVKLLAKDSPEFLTEFQRIVESTALES